MSTSQNRSAWGLTWLLKQTQVLWLNGPQLRPACLPEKSEVAGGPQQHQRWIIAGCSGSEAEQPARLDPALAHLLASARSDALRQEFLKAEPSSYATEHAVRIYAATYNLNGALASAAADPICGQILSGWGSLHGPAG